MCFFPHTVYNPQTSLLFVDVALTAMLFLTVYSVAASWSFTPHAVLSLMGKKSQLANEMFTVEA